FYDDVRDCNAGGGQQSALRQNEERRNAAVGLKGKHPYDCIGFDEKKDAGDLVNRGGNVPSWSSSTYCPNARDDDSWSRDVERAETSIDRDIVSGSCKELRELHALRLYHPVDSDKAAKTNADGGGEHYQLHRDGKQNDDSGEQRDAICEGILAKCNNQLMSEEARPSDLPCKAQEAESEGAGLKIYVTRECRMEEMGKKETREEKGSASSTTSMSNGRRMDAMMMRPIVSENKGETVMVSMPKWTADYSKGITPSFYVGQPIATKYVNWIPTENYWGPYRHYVKWKFSKVEIGIGTYIPRIEGSVEYAILGTYDGSRGVTGSVLRSVRMRESLCLSLDHVLDSQD
ncbi:MAG: hypothetical protein ACRDL7_01785, partial [Gaiellaceae bacterium]